MIKINKIYLGIMLLVAGVLNAAVTDDPFWQEYHVPHRIGSEPAMNDVRALAVDSTGQIWAATRAGVFLLKKDPQNWQPQTTPESAGPAFSLTVDKSGTVWVGAWNGLFHNSPTGLVPVSEITQSISATCATPEGILALGPDGFWRQTDGNWQRQPMPYARSVRRILPDPQNGWWVATGMGLYHQTESGVKLYQSADEILSAQLAALAWDKSGNLWAGGLGGVTILRGGIRERSLTPADGLPNAWVSALALDPSGRLWVGTEHGIARFNAQNVSVRHSRRWLVNDEVRDIVFDANGTAWIATADGVSAIHRKNMTLQSKANHFHRICLARHVRPPYIVEKCQLTVPGDTTSWKPRDDDNDGQYTSMYLAMEAYRYAVTKDPSAKSNAKQAFDALRFLQTVTETPGFFARTVIPVDWEQMADPNRKLTAAEWAEIRVDDPREKRVENMWRLSKDGKWRWKGDTSSDEMTGHMYGYLFYHDLVADAAEKKVVAAQVCRIVDYVIDGGYVLRDIDGTHTQWAVWSPEKLNHDPDWAAERGINSLEMLSYLKLAYHVSGKKKYQDKYLELIHKHQYAENARTAKTFAPSWRTHIDDELLALAFPALFLHETDPELREIYRQSLERWYEGIRGDQSPYFNLIYLACAGQDPEWRTTVHNLRDASLDLIHWRIDNSRREDIQVVRQPELENRQTHRILPPSEICTTRWDNNPWNIIQGDGGHTESDGVWWLLPYWMARYYRLIE